jgi:hypothetical protein
LVLLSGLGLFFSHALVFLLSSAAGILILISRLRWAALRHSWPYAILAALCVSYFFVLSADNADSGSKNLPAWGLWWVRIISYPLFTWTTLDELWLLALAVPALLSPFILGDVVNRRGGAIAPFTILCLIWAASPTYALKTAFLYERFAVFFLPFYAFLFTSRSPGQVAHQSDLARSVSGQLLLMGCCWTFLAVESVRLHRFAREAASFNTLLSKAEPGRRALALVLDPSSDGASHSWAYLHHPVWYQATKSGLVEFNFATYPPQMVRYRSEQMPVIGPDFAGQPMTFDWERHQGWKYDYYFVRYPRAGVPPDLFRGARCPITSIEQSERWALLEQRCEGGTRRHKDGL